MNKSILFIEAVQYGTYYDDRYAHITALGYDVFILYGEGIHPAVNPARRRVAGSRAVDTLRDAAHNWHREQRFSGLATLAEPSVLATAAISEVLGLPFASCATALASRDKFVMRTAHRRGDVAHPFFIGVGTAEDLDEWPGGSFPAIVKPTMGSASSFVFKVANHEELVQRARTVLDNAPHMSVAALEATGLPHTGPIALVESFLSGSEHLVEGYVFAGRFTLGSLVDRITVEGDTFDDDVHHAPSLLAPEAVEAVVVTVQAAVTAQGVDAAPIHAEIRFHDAIPHIVEVAIRPGGGGLNRMAELSYGYDPLRVVAQLALGEDPSHVYCGPGAIHTVAACLIGQEGTIRSITGADALTRHADVFFFKLLAAPGSVQLRPPRGNSILGFLGVTGTSCEDALARLATTGRMLDVDMAEELRHAS